MSLRAWAVALQAPLFVVVLIPAVVGASVAAGVGAVVPPLPFFLVLLTLVLIQAAANLQKGLVESADREGAVVVPSVFVFDSGAVERLPWSRPRLRGLVLGLFGAAGLLGLFLVVRYGDLILLALGVAGTLLGFFYRAPPLKLSYRGVGELPTFLAFGPLLVVGVAYLFTRTFPAGALWAGVILGFLASVISYARYFPLADEDARKEKRTPVVRLGVPRATKVLWVLLFAPYGVALVAPLFGYPLTLAFLATLPLALLVALFHRAGTADPKAYGRAVAAAVLLHAMGGLLLAFPRPLLL